MADNVRCHICGAAVHPGIPICGRCGARVPDTAEPAPVNPSGTDQPASQPDAPQAAFEATTARSALPPEPVTPPPPQPQPQPQPMQQVPPPQPPYDQAAPPGYPPPYQPFQSAVATPPPAGSAPPAVWLVILGLLAGGGLLLYPGLRYGGPIVGHLFESDHLTRAFAALIVFALLMFAASGAALIALAVGLLRGSRVAQPLTCLLCTVVAVGELVYLGDPGAAFGAPGQSHVESIVVVVVCALVVLLLIGLPGARQFFARDEGRPLGVLISSTVAAYFGGVMVLDGLLLMICGAVGVKFVWWGIGIVVAGAALLASLRPLRAGRGYARLGLSLAFVLAVVLLFVSVGSDNGPTFSFVTVVPLGLALGALGGLWLPASSQAHFATEQELARISPVAVAGWTVLTAASVAAALVGFASTPSSSAVADDPGYLPTVQPTPFDSQPAFPSDTPQDTPEDTPADTPMPTDTGVPTDDEPTMSAGPLTHVWTTTYTASGGFTVKAQLAVGAPHKLVAGLANGDVIAGRACSDISPETDALVPAVVTVTNTSSGGFTAYPAYELDFDWGYSGAEAELNYSDDGPSCESDSVQAEWANGLAPGESGESDMFFVVHDYYSPNHPNGDPSVLAAAQVGFADASSDQMQFTVGATLGPGVQDGTFSISGTG